MEDFSWANDAYAAAYAFNKKYKVGDMVIVRTAHDFVFGGLLARPAVVLDNQVVINLQNVPECFLLKQVLPRLK